MKTTFPTLPLRGRFFASSTSLLELTLPEHNEALVGDSLYSVTFNHEWRRIVASALQFYWQHGYEGLALDNEDLLNQVINDLYTAESIGAMEFEIGSAMQYFGSAAPSGWLFCNGSAISRTTYADLFAVIGTTYGAGDGSTTFNLPDLRGRAPIGAGQGSGLTNRALGAQLGAENHQLTIAEMPAHGHGSGTLAARVQSASGSNQNSAAGSSSGGGTFTGNINGTVASVGGDGAHNNMQPSLVCNFIIKF